MNSKNQILTIGITFIVIISILFFNIREEYSNEYKITTLEIEGINKITDIYKLDIILKSIRGINQLSSKDAKSLKNSLFIDEDMILEHIENLKDNDINKFYNKLIDKKNKLSKMEIYTQYTKLLKLLNKKRIDKADSSFLFFESSKDIYYLIITTILEIPQIIENIGKVRALGISILDNNNNNNEISFLLKTNLKSFIDKIEEIKHIIERLNTNDQNRLNALLNLIISDFYNIKTIVSDVEEGTSSLNSKEYFLEVSKLVNKIDNLFSTSKEILTLRLKTRESELKNKLILGTFLYILLVISILLSIYYNYRKSDRDNKLVKIKKEQRDFVQKLQGDYIIDNNLKIICNQSLNHIINYFNAINGSLYLFNEENEKLYLGALYGIKHDSLKQTLDMHENLISENILEKKIKIIDIDQKISLGNIETTCTKLVTIPIMEFEKSIGTIQLKFDKKFQNIDIDFLESTISLMGTYINKAQKDEESERYLKLIDKNVLISKTDLDGNITEVSEHFCTLSQYTKDELIGKKHNIVKHEDMQDNIFSKMWDTITKGETWQGELKNKKKDGGYYWIDTRISPDCDINGNTIGYTALRVDITDKKKIEQIAITDGLTQLYNRRHFDNIFPQQLQIRNREKNLLIFVLIDIDNFKQYNDTYGHQDGDTTLKLVATALNDTLKRSNDYTFRLGGEEFGLLYHIKNIEDAMAIANLVKEKVENLKIDHSGNSASKFVTISSGLYIIDNDNTLTINEIYKKTDEALYISKQSGRNRVSIAK